MVWITVDKLGFQCEPDGIVDGAGDEGAIYGIVRRAGVEVQLGVRRRRHEIDPGRPPNALGAYFFVEDAKARHDELLGRGADIASELRLQPWGMLDFTVRDPDGSSWALDRRADPRPGSCEVARRVGYSLCRHGAESCDGRR